MFYLQPWTKLTVLVNVYLRQERQDHFDDNSDDKAKLMTMSSKAKFVARSAVGKS